MKQFSDLSLMPPLLKSLVENSYLNPTPIQEQAIPILLTGSDLLGCAQTGTGKTAAFALPILQRLADNKSKARSMRPLALILTPTRELAVQIQQDFKNYGKYLPLKCAAIFGGVSQFHQAKALKEGTEILIATPGRLMDLYQQKLLHLDDLKIFVLDEADRMLDLGFVNDIKKLIKLLPKQRQTLFFSATMPPDILSLATSLLNTTYKKVEVAPVSSTAEKIQQSVVFVEKANKKALLRQLLMDPALKKVIVFTRTKHGANQVSQMLEKNRISSAAIHGNKSQNARQKALESFRDGEVRVLVATDIAARGIDVDHISHVINYELPNVAESYVHRIGRTARAGRSGQAIAFCDHEEKAYLRDIERLIGQKLEIDKTPQLASETVAKAPAMAKGKAKAQIDRKPDKSKRRFFYAQKAKGKGKSAPKSR